MEEKTVCRLCLKSCEIIFEQIEAVTLEMLGFLGLEFELNIKEKLVICRTCSENLQKCFDLKKISLYTEGYIKFFRNDRDNVKLDLKEIYLRKNTDGNILLSECDAVCRLCMEITESGCYVSLHGETREIMSAEAVLEAYFSELDLEITKNPVICTCCNDSLHTYQSFMKNCLDIKDRIKKYCETEKSSGNTQMEVNSVLPFEAEYTSNYENSYNGIDTPEHYNENELYDEIKLESENLTQTEFLEFHVKDEVINHDEADYIEIEELNDIVGKCHEHERDYETVLKCEKFVETGSSEFRIKHEEIDIKLEDGATAGFQDNTPILKDALAVDTDQCKICKQHLIPDEDVSKVVLHQCEECDYKTTPKCCLDTHKPIERNDSRHNRLLHKNISEVTYSCEMCTYKAKRKYDLKRHMLIHKNPSEVVTYSCRLCTYKAKRKGCLNRHMLIHKNASEVTMYSCGLCTYKVKEKCYLNRHMLIHKNASEITVYSCGWCTYKAKHKSSLKRHVLIHKNDSEVTMYSCEMCTYKAKHKSSLKRHMLVHKNASEVILYSCGICTYKAKQKLYLKRHMLIHKNAAEVTTYSCDVCTHKTKRKGDLQQHMLIHKDASEVIWYSCELCTYKAKIKRNLKQHMSSHKKLLR